MAQKTLEDALEGLIRYWNLRPDGGTRTELLQLAVLQGFEEALLAQWLDVFLQGFVETGHLNTPSYPELAAAVNTAGPLKAERAARAMFLYLTRDNRALSAVRVQNRIKTLTELVDKFTSELEKLADSRTMVQGLPASTNKVVALAAIDEAIETRTKNRTSTQREIDTLNGTL